MHPEEANSRRQTLLQRRADLEARQASKRRSLKQILVGAALDICGLMPRGRANLLQVELREVRWPLRAAHSSLRGLRILHLSDTHLDGCPGLTERLLELLPTLSYDLVVWTGDLRFAKGPYNPQEILPSLQLAAAMKPRLGIFFVPGNHDVMAMREPLQKAGIHWLHNESVLPLPQLLIAGCDDPHYFRCADPELALHQAPPPDDAFRLLLAHSPEAHRAAAKAGADLYLCGHTHGGQINLPIIGMTYYNARVLPWRARHSWSSGPMSGYTHPGTGASNLPVRFLCPPVITIHTLD